MIKPYQIKLDKNQTIEIDLNEITYISEFNGSEFRIGFKSHDGELVVRNTLYYKRKEIVTTTLISEEDLLNIRHQLHQAWKNQ